MKRLSRGNRSIIDLSLALACGAVFVALVWKLALTRGPLLPGLDGAYYWVQVRSLLERSRMAFDDVPSVFLLQAAVAKVLGDVPLAVRLTDACLPVFSAIPIYFMTRNSKYRFAPAVAVLVVLLHPVQLYFFTGDFIKNEAAIPLVSRYWVYLCLRVSIVCVISYFLRLRLLACRSGICSCVAIRRRSWLQHLLLGKLVHSS